MKHSNGKIRVLEAETFAEYAQVTNKLNYEKGSKHLDIVSVDPFQAIRHVGPFRSPPDFAQKVYSDIYRITETLIIINDTFEKGGFYAPHLQPDCVEMLEVKSGYLTEEITGTLIPEGQSILFHPGQAHHLKAPQGATVRVWFGKSIEDLQGV